MTPFAKFLTDNGHDYQAAADVLDITRSYVAQLASGKVKPGMKLAKKIFQWTAGAVKMEEW